MKKYKILTCLEQLTVKPYRIATKVLPSIIDKSHNTFWNYAKIDINSKMDIPYTAVVQLEQFFMIEPATLSNVLIQAKTLQEILQEHIK